ncbi:hypothetical protein M9Y10_023384 [Tritrichomonas musculus]|uniref:VPS9 domain-containing protein n=1 Tax=Tritrichomonas musculus TaxID=1915356 RepID=A0ABR2KVL1_9EUKA
MKENTQLPFKFLEENKILIPFINFDSTHIPISLPKSMSFEKYINNIKKDTFSRLIDIKTYSDSLIMRNAIVPVRKYSNYLPQHLTMQYHRLKFIEYKTAKLIKKFEITLSRYTESITRMFYRTEVIPPNFAIRIDFDGLCSFFSIPISKITNLQNLHKSESKIFDTMVNSIYTISSFDFQKSLLSILKEVSLSADESIRFFVPTALQEQFETLMLFSSESPCKKELIDIFRSFPIITPEKMTTTIVSLIDLIFKKYKIRQSEYQSYMVPLFFRLIFNEIYPQVTFFNRRKPATSASNPHFKNSPAASTPRQSKNSFNNTTPVTLKNKESFPQLSKSAQGGINKHQNHKYPIPVKDNSNTPIKHKSSSGQQNSLPPTPLQYPSSFTNSPIIPSLIDDNNDDNQVTNSNGNIVVNSDSDITNTTSSGGILNSNSNDNFGENRTSSKSSRNGRKSDPALKINNFKKNILENIDGTLSNGFKVYYNYSKVSNSDLFSYESFDDQILLRVHNLTVKDLQPPLNYCPQMNDDDLPSEVFKRDPNYSLAVEQIEFIHFFTNPLDILHHVYYSLHEIEMSAAIYKKDDLNEEMLPFDVVFGLFTCVVLASEVPEFLRIAAYTNVYAPQYGLCNEFEYAKTKLKSESVQLNQLLLELSDKE